MPKYRIDYVAGSVLAITLSCSAPQASADAQADYAAHCAACHGASRLGAIGPALLPENLRRLRKTKAAAVIGRGRVATQMPAFDDKLDTARISALVDYIYTPPKSVPEWGAPQIERSRIVHPTASRPLSEPEYSADPLNLFVVVEIGDHHVTVLDGDALEPIHRFPTRFALHGGPKYSPDGRYVYFGSRDGWISKYDLYELRYVAEIRAAINMRNIAVSADGRFVLAANYLPHSLVLLDADKLDLIEVIPVLGADGKSSRVSAVYAAPPRTSFIAALKDSPEVWELSYASEPFTIRKIALDGILDDFFFSQDYRVVVGAARSGGGQAVDLDAGQKIADLDLPGLPHLGSGITWIRNGKTVLATPNLKDATVSVIDVASWKTIRKIETLGPGFFMRSHEQSPYAWVDVFFGPDRDAVHVIDKQSLEIVKTLRPAPGKTAAHVEFNRDGSRALLSIWDMDGAIVVYDAQSLTEIKRLPMRKPSGKYNVWNKITRSRGTSH